VGIYRIPTNRLVGRDQFTQILGVEKLGQHRGSHYVAEQHRELTALARSVLGLNVLQPGAATTTELRLRRVLKAAFRACWP
jgi:hypothetical protein